MATNEINFVEYILADNKIIHFGNSNNVEVYPTPNRGKDDNLKPFGIEAKLNTEHNITNNGWNFSLKESFYKKTYNADETTFTLECNIKGYYIKFNNIPLIYENDENYRYVMIYLKPANLDTAGDDGVISSATATTDILSSIISGQTTLDFKIENKYYFIGAAFCKESLAGYITLDIQNELNQYSSSALDTTVFLSDDLYTYYPIGKIEPEVTETGITKKALVALRGNDLRTVFNNIMQPTHIAPTITEPTITANIPAASGEYGKIVSSVSYTITTTNGNCEYGYYDQATETIKEGSDVTWDDTKYKFTFGSDTYTTKTGTIQLSDFRIGISPSINYSAEGQHSDSSYAVDNVGEITELKIEGATKTTQTYTFNPSPDYNIYYKVSDDTTIPETWQTTGSPSVTLPSISYASEQYVWVAAKGNYTKLFAKNQVSGQYDIEIDTVRLTNQTIVNAQGVNASGYVIFRFTNPTSFAGSIELKVA